MIVGVIAAAALVTGAGGYGVYKLTRSEPVATPPDAMMREAIPQTPMDATLAVMPAPRVPPGPMVNLDFKDADVREMLKTLAAACNVNLAISGSLRARQTLKFTDVPCDQAIESVLESVGLAYDYTPPARLVLVDSRERIDEDRAKRASSQRRADDRLPPGPTVNLDYKDASISNVVASLTKVGGVNVVIPDVIQAQVTIVAKDIPWDDALRAVLHSNGLGYTYRPNGKIVRIDSQIVLDAEAAHRP